MDTLMHAVSTLYIHDVVLLLNCPKVIRLEGHTLGSLRVEELCKGLDCALLSQD